MRAWSVALVLCLGGCVVQRQSQPSREELALPGPDLTAARFCARQPGSSAEQPLQLASFSVKVDTGPHTVRSHLTLVVKNPGARPAEAALRLPIPPGAAVTRAVLHVDQRPMEGAFVQRDRARAIYRRITERRRDPALVAWRGPEWVEVAIFPVAPAGGERTFELQWVEPAAVARGRVWYRVPVLAHRGQVVGRPGHLVADGKEVEVGARAWIPLRAQAPAAPAAARAPGDPFGVIIARTPAAAAASQPAATPRLVVVAETAAGMTVADRRRQRRVLEELLTALPATARVTLLRADWGSAALTESARPDAVRAALGTLDAVPSAGALDLERALDAATDRARAAGAGAVVWVGHGADGFRGDALAGPLRKLQAARVALSVVGLPTPAAPLADAAWLTGGRAFTADEVRAPTLRAVLARPPAAPAAGPPGIESWHPLETATGEVVWLARFTGAAPAGAGTGVARHLEALWARASVVGSSGRADDPGEAHHVLTPLTSILVLERDADYRRWGLAVPRAPEDEGRPVATPSRPGTGAPSSVGAAPDPEAARARLRILGIFRSREATDVSSLFGRDATGAEAQAALGDLLGVPGGETGGIKGLGTGGDIGTIGTAGGGSAAGYGRSGRAPRGAAPQVRVGSTEVRGSLSKEIIRRIVRIHRNEVRFCYEVELRRRPALAGRVVVRFVIAPTGAVASATVQSSTLGNRRVEQCIAAAVRRWRFPQPQGGGIVIVTFPFELRPGPGSAPLAVVDDRWSKALALLAAAEPLEARVGTLATLLGAPPTTSAPALGWWLVQERARRRASWPEAHQVAALLLEAGGADRDARRVLAEAAPRDPNRLAEVARHLGWSDDADRLAALAPRR